MVPLAQAALAQIGYDQNLDAEVIDAFFEEIDSDGNGKIDKTELQRFMRSLM
jgi:Ca2+-binding EF-hand superfamily protein